jgi:hypothetical protein
MKRLVVNSFKIMIIIGIVLVLSMNKSNAASEDKTKTINLCGVDVEVGYSVVTDSDKSYITSFACKEPEKLNGELVIPKTIDGLNVTNLGYAAFKNATGIASVVIPATLEDGGTESFKGCTNLKEIKFDSDVRRVPSFILEYCEGIEDVTIPDYVTELGSLCFANCPNLKNITLSKNLAVMGGSNFEGCTALTSITIPKSLGNTDGSIGHYNFKGCTNLKDISFEKGITRIPHFLFYGAGSIEEIEIPDTVVEIDNYAFTGCKSLKQITLPEAIEEIGIEVFDDCTSLEKITVYDNVKSMGWVDDIKNLDIWRKNGLENMFSNHNSNLTMYCYKDSFADEYAKMLGLKIVYMEKDHPTQTGVENVQHYTSNDTYYNVNVSNNIINNNTIRNNVIKNNTIKNTAVDNTISNSILPYTGQSLLILILSIVFLAVAGILYKNISEYKDL